MPSPSWRVAASSTRPDRVWVGLDLGTSGLKGVAVDDAGAVLARGQQAYPTYRPEPGACEQDPQDWLVAVDAVVAQLLEVVPADRWAGIGLSAMLPTLVTVDGSLGAVGPAITWEDGRADAYGDALREAGGPDHVYRRTGQWVDGRYLLPMWQRVAATDDGRAAQTAMLLGAKDFVLSRLVGRTATDPSTAAGFGCFDLAAGRWDPQLRDLVPDLPALPDVVPSASALPLLDTAAEQLGLPSGLPVCVGAADSVLGALGMGVSEPGDVAYVAGTSTVVLGVAGTVVHDPLHRFLVTPMALPGTWGLEMDLLSTGAAIRWLAALLGVPDERAALALAAAVEPAATPVFLPYVAPGEQGALWDPGLTGTVVGLTLAHGAGDLVAGLVQGIVVESARCLATLESTGFDRRPVRVAGGSASDAWFRQQLADASGREVVAPVDGDSDYSALGAASLTSVAVTGRALATTLADTVTTRPDTSTTQAWERRTQQHETARASVGHGVRSTAR
jgi:sugar (pentulose or hexulose) kinase